ncbi:MAG: hypothetical protein UZ07_CHB004001434 [Chlorobi bacterium OLB7]|nr:MAG: hypothetical protein UZ07_CHB004001434 [Chlorobi bacterium OLB7]
MPGDITRSVRQVGWRNGPGGDVRCVDVGDVRPVQRWQISGEVPGVRFVKAEPSVEGSHCPAVLLKRSIWPVTVGAVSETLVPRIRAVVRLLIGPVTSPEALGRLASETGPTRLDELRLTKLEPSVEGSQRPVVLLNRSTSPLAGAAAETGTPRIAATFGVG